MRPQTPSALIVWLWRAVFLGAAAAGAALPGCNGSSDATTAASDESAVKTAAPLASIGAAKTAEAPPQLPEPVAGTPQSLLHEAKMLRMKPLAGVTSADQIAAAQLARQKELVRLTTEVIAKTHDEPASERTFDDAAFLLMNARLQLALCDDEQVRNENVDALYEHAEAFHRRNPESKAAAEAAFAVAKLAHENARRHGSQEWLEEFARQAQVFATKFPKEESRGPSLLFSAGWSCELHGLTQPATACYTQIADRFPGTEEAVTAAGSLRRLKLVGQPLQLGGSTLDGGYVSIDEYAGKPVLVLFWQASNPKVADLMPVLADLQAAHGENFGIIGVALDEDESAVREFLDSCGLKWKQIFFADPSKRGWKNTVAEFYGVKSVPALWLVGSDGKVRATNLSAETARQAVANAR
ncbi:MAG: TlpA family protein disulfide reductase [Planctomycetota bacterium]|nr:TlpA family protein disulfide reductase [Planctomycetaceae bacterium]MDQ3330109.1 TlpA family protein disulfide reductase [Planctomycetota bacterium]